MSEVTRILSAIEQGDSHAAAQLLPLIYDELRKLAAVQMARDRPGETLNPTALVHEAYLRLVGEGNERRYHDRGHFFAAAATAMRHIRIDQSRRKKTQKRGGNETRRARRGGRSESRRRTLGRRRSTDPIGGPGRAKSATGGERLAHRRLGSVTAVGGW